MITSPQFTDLSYGSETAWFDFSYYFPSIPYHTFFKLNRSVIKKFQHNIQEIYNCPDLRGLDSLGIGVRFSTEIDERQAENLARSMLPTCNISHRDHETNECYMRPELNVKHDNPTGCVMFDLGELGLVAVYAYVLSYPRDMNILKFTQTRNVSQVKRVCYD